MKFFPEAPIRLTRRDRTGFTLIEVLIATAILTSVSLVMMSSFIQGIKVFDRFNIVLNEEKCAFVLDELTHDLKNNIPYSRVPWAVSKDSISFASVSLQIGDPLGGLPMQVGYRLDADKKTIIRTQNVFPYDPTTTETRVLADHVQSLTFDVVMDFQESSPSRVLVSMEYGEASRPRSLEKYILIPTSYRGVQNS